MILKEIMNVNDTRIMAIVTTRSRAVFFFKSILPVLIGCFNVKCYPAIDEKLVLQHEDSQVDKQYHCTILKRP
jgi:hypothetical protein